MTQNTHAFDRHGPRPSEGDTAYSSPDEAAAAYHAHVVDYVSDLNAWAIDEISQYGALKFLFMNSPTSLPRNFRGSDTYATLVHDLYLGAWELS